MDVKQIHTLVNSATQEVLGESGVLSEDLTNVVDIGTEIFNASAVDRYVKSLVNHIGKVIFVDRAYAGSAPSVLMDGWEYGSVLQKIQADLPDAEENESWQLENGETYDPNIFYQPSVSAKFFNSKTTFDIPMSFTEKQVKQSFSSAAQLNAFLSMLFNTVDKSLTVKTDAMIMRTIGNMITETVHDSFGADPLNAGSHVRAVNLLYQYNQKFSAALTAEQAMITPAFIRYSSFVMGLYVDRMRALSTLFNVGGKARFTPNDLLHVVLLSEFKNSAAAYLESDTYHDAYVKLPDAETVPFWQGSGEDYAFDSTSKVMNKNASANTLTVPGILGVMFDRDALGVANLDRRVTTNYNPKAEFYTNFYKFDAAYFNDLNENFVVFFAA